MGTEVRDTKNLLRTVTDIGHPQKGCCVEVLSMRWFIDISKVDDLTACRERIILDVLVDQPVQKKYAVLNDRVTSIFSFAQRPGLFQSLKQRMSPQLLQAVEGLAK